MNVSIPILVSQVDGHAREDGSVQKLYQVRPLFFQAPVQQDRKLPQAMTRLERDLEKHIDSLAEAQNYEALAELTWFPELTERTESLVIKVRGDLHRGRYFFVLLHALGRTLAFAPSLPELWFDVPDLHTFPDRAQSVLTAWFRKQEKEEDGLDPAERLTPEQIAKHGTAWVSSLDVTIRATHPTPKTPRPFAFLGASDTPQGRKELEKVGRNLSRIPDEDLGGAVLRDREVLELERLLLAPERRPLLLVGPPGSGKTAILHELIRRRRLKPPGTKLIGDLYLVAPQRLIAGMMFVGQWEERLLAILQEMKRADHILYVDDLPGLLHAGTSASSNLTVGVVLQPWLERRDVRFVGEITPEALRVMRERARGLIDLCHIIPVRPTTDQETQRILIQLLRDLEARHSLHIDPLVIPLIIQLQRRFEPVAAFPGKAASLLQRVATRSTQTLTVENVLKSLAGRTGLNVQISDAREPLERSNLLETLRKGVIGQQAALEALADVVSVFRARLNDTGRPVANLLFLGPTGVGKTETAKTLARWLYGANAAGANAASTNADPSNPPLIRFDLNEFVGADAVSRLVGTVYEPEGLLTAAIRRRPFAVVLFDEIEKAHPSVFNLLLQVLGEGRLTDALGRTADFTNAIILLTSNLGVREASRLTGFDLPGRDSSQAFVRAAEAFFSPEFFNRIDRVIPFSPLSKDEIRQIIRLELASIASREGFQRRRLSLSVDEGAQDWLVEQGYHPTLGARALKRVLERALVRPLADRLTALPTNTLQARHPILARAFKGPRGLLLDVRPLEPVARVTPVELPPEDGQLTSRMLKVAQALAAQTEDTLSARRKALPPSDASPGLPPQANDRVIYALEESLEGLQETLSWLESTLEGMDTGDETDMKGLRLRHVKPRSRMYSRWEHGPSLDDVCAADDMRHTLKELFTHHAGKRQKGEDLRPLKTLHLAHLLLQSIREKSPEQIMVFGNWYQINDLRDRSGFGVQAMLASSGDPCVFERIEDTAFQEAYRATFQPGTPEVLNGRTLATELTGPLSGWVGPQLEGFVLWIDEAHFELVETTVVIPEPHESLEDALRRRHAQIRDWKAALARGEVGLEQEPFPPGKLRAIVQNDSCLCLANGQIVAIDDEFFWHLALASLPPPASLLESPDARPSHPEKG